MVITEHLICYPEMDTLWNARKLDVYKTSCAVNCVSYYVLRSLLVTRIPVSNVSVIGNLLDEDNQVFAIPNPNTIIFVACHPYEKGLDMFIEVAKLLRETNWHIDWYGVESATFLEDYGVVQDIIDSAEIGNVVTVKGFVEHKELLTKYSSYSLLLSTSVSETFGLSVAEAIMSRVPVVCTDSGGIRDFVNERNGIIVPIGDSVAAVSAIERLSKTVLDMAAASEEILKKYSKDNYKKKVIAVFNNAARTIKYSQNK